MRIISLRFKNLNSLQGEWQIDFDDPAYEANGIFAITGPTGAGKSTLLDAISLALYGRTPRLARLTKTENEIMSKRTGECFAELAFETTHGQFRVHWSHHRARRSPTGELQNPKHELSKIPCGTVIAHQLRTVSDQIEQLTGMDFDRFTRSMLLAQGSFAAFLQANSDERAPILEQITGTEIYSVISRTVHERYSLERKKFDDLNTQLNAVELLSTDQEELLQTQLKDSTEQSQVQSYQLDEHKTHLNKLGLKQQLQVEQQKLTLQQQQLDQELSEFAPLAAQLQQAEKAHQIAVPYATLTLSRDELSIDVEKLELQQQKQPLLLAEQAQSLQQLEQIQTRFQQLQQEFAQAQPIWQQVNQLDLNSLHQAEQTERLQQNTSQLQQQYQEKTVHLQSLATELERTEQKLAELQQFLEQHAVDAHLANELGVLQTRAEQQLALETALSKNESELKAAQQRYETAIHAVKEPKALLAQTQQDVKELNHELAQLKTAKATLLQDQKLSFWRERQLQLQNQKNTLSLATQQVSDWLSSQDQITLLQSESVDLLENKEKFHTLLQQYLANQAQQQQQADWLQQTIQLQQRIHDLEQERQRLIAGEACPLCGSTEHPYVTETFPVLTENELEFKQVKITIKQLQEQIAITAKEEMTIEAALAQNQKNQHSLNQKIAEYKERLQQQQPELSLDEWNPSQLKAHFIALQQALEIDLNQNKTVLTELENIEENIKQLEQSQQQKQKIVHQIELQIAQLAQQQDKEQTEITRLQQSLQNLKADQAKALSQINQRLSCYKQTVSSASQLAELCTQLQKRYENWLEQQQKSQTLQQYKRDLSLQQQHQTEQFESIITNLKNQQTALEQSQKTWQNTVQQRQALFGDQDTKKQEQLLTEQLTQTQHAVENAQKDQQQKQQLVLQHEANTHLLEQRIAQRRTALLDLESNFNDQLTQLDFENEKQFLAVRLEQTVFQQLLDQQQQLQKRFTALHLQNEALQSQLQSLQAYVLTPLAITELEQLVAQLSSEQQQLQQNLGAIKQQLENNEQKKQQLQSAVIALQQQEIEQKKWASLHELIGSADGKKFRNFAQGLTFELMVGYANQQLQKMSDRYLLVRDPNLPLELTVIDNYQAGEVRSTKNLSGGESFIVSLALALGLSQMSSQNTRIDSLFLDEGFGTLDEEALDTALETLATLRQESKLIGVISHIPALKERISTRITIQPRLGGHSHLSGPGCQQH